MTPGAESRNHTAGYTIFDIMVGIAGFAVGGWISNYFDGTDANLGVLDLVDCVRYHSVVFHFPLVVALIDRRREAAREPDDHSRQ